MNAIAFDS